MNAKLLTYSWASDYEMRKQFQRRTWLISLEEEVTDVTGRVTEKVTKEGCLPFSSSPSSCLSWHSLRCITLMEATSRSLQSLSLPMTQIILHRSLYLSLYLNKQVLQPTLLSVVPAALAVHVQMINTMKTLIRFPLSHTNWLSLRLKLNWNQIPNRYLIYLEEWTQWTDQFDHHHILSSEETDSGWRTGTDIQFLQDISKTHSTTLVNSTTTRTCLYKCCTFTDN